MYFTNREDAGIRLAKQLEAYAGRNDVIVLGIPRGGVAVAFEVAESLRVPLDVCLARKLGVPEQEELAFGAVAAGGIRYLNDSIIRAVCISNEDIERITHRAQQKLEEREAIFRRGKPPLDVTGRTVILIDDGIATGASMQAAVLALRQMRPAKLIVAVPVAPLETCERLRPLVDELVCLSSPMDFYAVGQFYDDFPQVEDGEVLAILRRAPVPSAPPATTPVRENPQTAGAGSTREVSIPADDVYLAGTLVIPPGAKAIVLFVHGSGSSRHSPRNRQVAAVLNAHGLATLLFDLLTTGEEEIDRWSAELRFNIEMLTQRLVQVTQWIMSDEQTKEFSIGYFGASTGAAAALRGAAQLPASIGAVVSRGGRPDLAHEALARVSAPTLLLVGSRDEEVLALNEQALRRLASKEKQLQVIPGATHLFEEPGTLDQVAAAAADWFTAHLLPPDTAQHRDSTPHTAF